MITRLRLLGERTVARLSVGYRSDARPLAVLRILMAVQILLLPVDISWIADIPPELYDPPPGPFALVPGPVSAEAIIVIELLRAAVAIWVLIGWRTRTASIVLSAVLVFVSGLNYSFSKVDHFVLFDLAPLALGLAGWGATWSVDAWRRRAAAVDGFWMLLYAITIGFALLTAALPKAASGWLNPLREATHSYVARDALSGTDVGVLSQFALGIDSPLFWKALDYATVFAEGWLIFAVLSPGLFRLGLIVISLFHVGVWLLLDINFALYAFVYAGFFCLAPRRWFPEWAWLRRRLARRRALATGRAEAPAG